MSIILITHSRFATERDMRNYMN